MRWRSCSATSVLGAVVWLLFMAQGWLPLNPDGVPGLRWDTGAAHDGVVSSPTPTSSTTPGQAQLSYLSQMVGIVGLQVVTPMMGLALVVATLRALFGGRETPPSALPEGEARDVGNFWVDVMRADPARAAAAVPAVERVADVAGRAGDARGRRVVTPVDGTRRGHGQQVIPVGPVAPMVAVKQLGTNGGGWYGPNSSVPLENPTPFSNLLELLAIILVPIAVAFMVGSVHPASGNSPRWCSAACC
jgi:K+-transporting ATPase ATPase A chain